MTEVSACIFKIDTVGSPEIFGGLVFIYPDMILLCSKTVQQVFLFTDQSLKMYTYRLIERLTIQFCGVIILN